MLGVFCVLIVLDLLMAKVASDVSYTENVAAAAIPGHIRLLPTICFRCLSRFLMPLRSCLFAG